MTWEQYLKEHLPLTDEGDIHLCDMPGTMEMRGQRVPTTVSVAVSTTRMVQELFGVVLTGSPPDGPLPEQMYQALLSRADEMGSPLWREYWEQWRAEGRI